MALSHQRKTLRTTVLCAAAGVLGASSAELGTRVTSDAKWQTRITLAQRNIFFINQPSVGEAAQVNWRKL